jgi:phosphoribosylglycinamide formyltransferase-1
MSDKKTPIAIFASGRGSNFDAIQAAVARGELNAEIRLVLSDRADAPVLEKARQKSIPTVCIAPNVAQKSPEARRAEHEKRILEALREQSPRFLVLAGYMRIMTPLLIEAFRSERGYSRIVNIHPSLLPAFPGVDAYRQAFEFGTKLTGATVHLVETEVDSGPVCAQESFSIAGCKSVSEVESLGLELEHRLFPGTLRWVLGEAFSVEKRQGGRFCVREN